MFSLRNEVLGYIDVIPSEFNKANTSPLFKAPTNCKFCEEKLSKDENFLFCTNKKCKLNVVGKIVNFLEKNNVKGIKANTIFTVIC